MSKENTDQNSKAAQALAALEQAWAYYTPEPLIPVEEREPELFEYASAA